MDDESSFNLFFAGPLESRCAWHRSEKRSGTFVASAFSVPCCPALVPYNAKSTDIDVGGTREREGSVNFEGERARYSRPS